MSNTSGNTERWGEDESGQADVDREVGVLLEKLGNWGLGRAIELIRNEMKNRLEGLEKDLSTMKQYFDNAAPATKDDASVNKSKRAMGKKSISGTLIRNIDKGRAKKHRGQLTGAIPVILGSGPKSRAELEVELTKRGIPTKSLATLLARMKKKGKVNHDKTSKKYSLSINHCQVAADEVVATNES